MAKKYSDNWYDCVNDVPSCCAFSWCGACATCCLLTPLLPNAKEEGFGCTGIALGAYPSTGFWPCTLFCGGCGHCCGICSCYPKNMIPCFLSRLLDKSMTTHGITEFPGPCGGQSCCEGDKKFYCQMCFCASCTLCLMYREAKTNYKSPEKAHPETVQNN